MKKSTGMDGRFGVFVGVNVPKEMNRSQRQLTFRKTDTFRKTAACPASTTLLGFRAKALSPMLGTLVRQHLESCEFCTAELSLLAHNRAERGSAKTPEIPTNLRILAESILGDLEKTKV